MALIKLMNVYTSKHSSMRRLFRMLGQVMATGNSTLDDYFSKNPSATIEILVPYADQNAIKEGFIAVTGVKIKNGRTKVFQPCGKAKSFCLTATVSTRIRYFDPDTNSTTYSTPGGTSSATAYTSGVALALKQKYDWFSAKDIKNTLFTTAIDRGYTGIDAIWGVGELDKDRALLGYGRFDADKNNDLNVTGVAQRYYFDNNIAGDGGFIKRGEKELILNGDNTFAGIGVIKQGKVTLNGNNTASFTVEKDGTLASGTRFKLDWSSMQSLPITSGSVDNAGTLESLNRTNWKINGDLTNQDSGVINKNIGAKIQVTGTATLGGKLNVRNIATGYIPKTGHREVLLEAGNFVDRGIQLSIDSALLAAADTIAFDQDKKQIYVGLARRSVREAFEEQASPNPQPSEEPTITEVAEKEPLVETAEQNQVQPAGESNNPVSTLPEVPTLPIDNEKEGEALTPIVPDEKNEIISDQTQFIEMVKNKEITPSADAPAKSVEENEPEEATSLPAESESETVENNKTEQDASLSDDIDDTSIKMVENHSKDKAEMTVVSSGIAKQGEQKQYFGWLNDAEVMDNLSAQFDKLNAQAMLTAEQQKWYAELLNKDANHFAEYVFAQGFQTVVHQQQASLNEQQNASLRWVNDGLNRRHSTLWVSVDKTSNHPDLTYINADFKADMLSLNGLKVEDKHRLMARLSRNNQRYEENYQAVHKTVKERSVQGQLAYGYDFSPFLSLIGSASYGKGKVKYQTQFNGISQINDGHLTSYGASLALALRYPISSQWQWENMISFGYGQQKLTNLALSGVSKIRSLKTTLTSLGGISTLSYQWGGLNAFVQFMVQKNLSSKTTGEAEYVGIPVHIAQQERIYPQLQRQIGLGVGYQYANWKIAASANVGNADQRNVHFDVGYLF
ncbi:hypothetical protein EIG79_05545 [Avibacterium paragallinarum]|uniref:Peptidase S8/S53 domain-containing protein n=2 Tax=Avibacterium paragallinarum TaxID=728 RepID=A0A8B3T7G9_AVIPA|nr:hypothetical protein EIG79_05545 [Avibacterium paragallinarum]